ncbi:hypothetical protein BX667DRAFT_501137, partial [Coemansia mojavensis]
SLIGFYGANEDAFEAKYTEFINDNAVPPEETVVVFYDLFSENYGCFTILKGDTLHMNQSGEFGSHKNRSFSHVYAGGIWKFHAFEGNMQSSGAERFALDGKVTKYKELPGEDSPKFAPIFTVNSCEVSLLYMWKGEYKLKSRDVICCSYFNTPISRLIKGGTELLSGGFEYEEAQYNELCDIPGISSKGSVYILFSKDKELHNELTSKYEQHELD